MNDEFDKDDCQKSSSITSFDSNCNLLFYTFDKSLEIINDKELNQYLIKTYPTFVNCKTKLELKKIFLQMLDDSDFIHNFLNDFEMTFIEMFGFFYRNYPDLFDSKIYLKKMYNVMQGKDYVNLR